MSPRSFSSLSGSLQGRTEALLWLYRRAAAVCEPGLRLILEENAQTLAGVIADLRAASLAIAKWKQKSLSCSGAVGAHVLVGLLRVAGNREPLWVAFLARREAALLHAFEHGAKAAPPVTARLLERQLRHLRALQRDMHCLLSATGS